MIALMPDTWLKMAKRIAKVTGNLYFLENREECFSFFFNGICECLMALSSCSKLTGLIRFKMASASASYPLCRINQRGLSGTKNSKASRNNAGATSAPSIQRQPVVAFHVSSPIA